MNDVSTPGPPPDIVSAGYAILMQLTRGGDPLLLSLAAIAAAIGWLWWRDNRELARLRQEIEQRAIRMERIVMARARSGDDEG